MSVLKSNKNMLKNRLTPNEMMFMLKHFARKEDGAMTLFAVFMFLMMILVAGLGVDLMRHEMERTKIQNTIDRAVLAAADLDQTLDPSAVVTDYMDKAGVGQHLSEVNVNEGLNFRTVTATAQATTPTQFMSMLGVDTLTSPARVVRKNGFQTLKSRWFWIFQVRWAATAEWATCVPLPRLLSIKLFAQKRMI